MILPIYTYNHSKLRQVTAELTTRSQNKDMLDSMINDMFETMHNAGGAGLAAPQIGISLRLLVIEFEVSAGTMFKGVFINPKVLDHFGPVYAMEESCLSLPGIKAKVERHGSILLEYYDENWKKHNEFFHDMQSRVLQHEIDHLDGKLYIDRVDDETRLSLASALSEIEQGKIKCKYETIV